MPGLSQPIRFIPNKSQLRYFPWQRYLEMRKVTHQVADIMRDVAVSIADPSGAGTTVPIDLEADMKPFVLADKDVRELNNKLGEKLSAGTTWGKWLAFFKQESWNPYFQVLQEHAHESASTRHKKIEEYNQQLHKKLQAVYKQLDTRRLSPNSRALWTVWLAKKRIAYIRDLYFDPIPQDADKEVDAVDTKGSVEDKVKSGFDSVKKYQGMTTSRKVTFLMTVMFAVLAVGTLAVIAGSGILGAPLAAVVGWGAIKVILAPSVWLASLALPSMSTWYFIPMAVSFIANALIWIHSAMFAETSWRFLPFHKPHMQVTRVNDFNLGFKALMEQFKHLSFLRLPGEEARKNDSFVTLDNWQIVLKACFNPLRLVYATLSLVHGVLNFAIDLVARFVGLFFSFDINYQHKASSFVAGLFKAPVDVVFTVVYLSAEIIIKATDVVWNLVLPTLGKLFIGGPLTAKLAWDHRKQKNTAPTTSSRAHTTLSKKSIPQPENSTSTNDADSSSQSSTSDPPVYSRRQETHPLPSSAPGDQGSDKEDEAGLTSGKPVNPA